MYPAAAAAVLPVVAFAAVGIALATPAPLKLTVTDVKTNPAGADLADQHAT